MATIVDESAIPKSAATAVPRRGSPRIALTAALAASVAIVAVFADTAWSIVSIWIRSETFTHGFVVIPIALWLGWRKREELAAARAAPWFPGAALVALCGALWAILTIGGVLVGSQFALAFMVIAAFVSIVGLRAARVLAFPLAFLLFAVPAGEVLVPTLIDWTADFTVAALRLSGVPVYREANHFIIPSGAWSVVEACSGLRYLIASLMTGVLFAALVYRSASRRIAFVAASIIVPVFANWLRAYMIVMLGHLSGNTIAVGVDHFIYGWVFFGVVLLLLFWVGSLWSEHAPAASDFVRAPDLRAPAPASRFTAAAVLAIVLAAVWRPVPAMFGADVVANGSALQPVGAARGWTPSAVPPLAWRPDYKGMTAELNQGFTSASGPAGLYVAQYRGQARGREMITTANALVSPSDRVWRAERRGAVEVSWNGTPVTAQRTTVLGNGTRITVYSLYWIDGVVTSSGAMAKLGVMLSRLRGRGDDSMLVVAYAADSADRDAARELLEAYAPELDNMFRRVAPRAR
ncbi:MAG: exosortase A [Burkholderiales bacterium]|nr:exosortase A [Burkholderiales bacterium]